MTTIWLSAAVGPKSGGGSYAVTAGPTDALADITSATALAAFASAMNTATTGYIALMGGTAAYSNTTGATSGTVGISGGSVTLTQSHGNSLLALMGTAGVAAVAAQNADAQSGTVIVGYDGALTTAQIKSALQALIARLGV